MTKSKIKLTDNQKTLIEKMGMAYEQSGFSPVPARLLALLMVAEDPDLTFDQLQATLGISKSATSNSINLLLNTGKIEQISKLGERKRYFRNRIVHWKEDIKKTNERMGLFVDLMKTILKQRPGDTVEFNQSLKEMIDFVEFLQRELPLLYKKWETGRK
ncbi:MAG: MarR family transcriptional regulator [Bacteroidetes bacterium]|nr:MarR family transcriptional regulator [Bacteroidota bacterium]